jgi:hypothetical protein
MAARPPGAYPRIRVWQAGRLRLRGRVDQPLRLRRACSRHLAPSRPALQPVDRDAIALAHFLVTCSRMLGRSPGERGVQQRNRDLAADGARHHDAGRYGVLDQRRRRERRLLSELSTLSWWELRGLSRWATIYKNSVFSGTQGVVVVGDHLYAVNGVHPSPSLTCCYPKVRPHHSIVTSSSAHHRLASARLAASPHCGTHRHPSPPLTRRRASEHRQALAGGCVGSGWHRVRQPLGRAAGVRTSSPHHHITTSLTPHHHHTAPHRSSAALQTWPFTAVELGHDVDMEALACGPDGCADFIYVGDEYNYIYKLDLGVADPAQTVKVEWDLNAIVGAVNL